MKNNDLKWKLIILLLALLCQSYCHADAIDSLRNILERNDRVQEKIYLQLDNTCYFKGDTLWYKAYTLRADNLVPTDMSKLLYVELITPDGYLVERQHVIIDKNGASNGSFILFDSIYSGYYELRAYTKWNLNYNVSHREYTNYDSEWFFCPQYAKDYFRDFEGLYSRVFPIYEKPDTAGEYMSKYIVSRPKRRVEKEKSNVNVTFFPEGGRIIESITNRIALEVTDQQGKGIETECKIGNLKFKTDAMGRTSVLLLPMHLKERLTLTYQGKGYSFRLPDAAARGAAMRYNAVSKNVIVESNDTRIGAYAVLCRGKMIHFERLSGKSAEKFSLKEHALPTGVNEILVFDDEAQILCSRQIFINNGDYGKPLNVTLSRKDEEIADGKTSIMPYEKVDITISSEDRTLKNVCISIRDTKTDEPTYDNSNILIDLLLCGDLKGFVANPQYYFSGNDNEHILALDKLMMIQGWRKYKQPDYFRYKPEKTLTFEGRIAENEDSISISEIIYLAGNGGYSGNICSSGNYKEDRFGRRYIKLDNSRFHPDYNITDIFTGQVVGKEKKNKLARKEILVEAEIIKDKDIAGAATKVDRFGRFSFQIPPYYGKAILFVTAYDRKDSVKMCITSTADPHKGNFFAHSKYFVTRDLFFPVFTQPYSWYQTHNPEEIPFEEMLDEITFPINNKLEGEHYLSNVTVKGHRRRSLRAFNKARPAIVRDMYEIYNECADRGLWFGNTSLSGFAPSFIARCLFGNMNSFDEIRVRAEGEGHYTFINYPNPTKQYGRMISAQDYQELNDFRRTKDVRIYTDYDMRNGTGKEINHGSPDVHLEYIYLPENGKRPVSRDRRYILDGIACPAEFYSRDYSSSTPDKPEDYRRTLYWNPDAKLNADGCFTGNFYGKSQECRVKVTACGVSHNGQIFIMNDK